MKKSDWILGIVSGASMGLIIAGGALLQQHNVTPFAQVINCAEDDPCWNSATMGNNKAGQPGKPGTVCTWDGTAWQWDLVPGLVCPWNYSK